MNEQNHAAAAPKVFNTGKDFNEDLQALREQNKALKRTKSPHLDVDI